MSAPTFPISVTISAIDRASSEINSTVAKIAAAQKRADDASIGGLNRRFDAEGVLGKLDRMEAEEKARRWAPIDAVIAKGRADAAREAESVHHRTESLTEKLAEMEARAAREREEAHKKHVEALRTVNDKLGEGIARIAEFGVEAVKVIGEVTAVTFELTRRWTEHVGSIKEAAFVAGMASDEYQQWSYATKMLGVDTETYNTSMTRFTRQIALARNHQGEFYKSFAGSPLLKQIQQAKTNSEALELMYRALDRSKDANERNAMAMAAFGRGGAEMNKALHDGLPALLAMRDEQQRLGGVTEDGFEAAEKFERSWNRTTYALMGVGNAIGTELSPVLAGYLDKARDWLVTNKKIIASKVTDFVERFWKGLERVGSWLAANESRLEKFFVGTLDTAARVSGFLVDHLDDVATGIKLLGGIWVGSQLVSGVSTVAAAATTIASAFGASAASAGVIGSSMGALTVAVGAWTAAYYLWRKALDEFDEFQTWKKNNEDAGDTLRNSHVAARQRVYGEAGMGTNEKDVALWTDLQSNPALQAIFAGNQVSTPGAMQGTVTVHVLLDEGLRAIAKTEQIAGNMDTQTRVDVGTRMPSSPMTYGRH